MKEITIKIYGWSDMKKWFWDQFCFPRRKLVVEWLDYHNCEIRSLVEKSCSSTIMLTWKKTIMLFCPKPSKIGRRKAKRYLIIPRNL